MYDVLIIGCGITGAAAAQTPTPTVEQLPEAEAPAVTG